MLILSKDGDQIINTDNVTNIFIKAGKIAANYTNGTGSQIGQYGSEKEARTALKLIHEHMMLKDDGGCAPDDQMVKSRIALSENKMRDHHTIDGKKRKGHGGS